MTRQKTLILVRHAHADYCPDEHRLLSKQGMRDARLMCEGLRKHGITSIYSSPYRRAIDTALPLAKSLSLPVYLCNDLLERRLSAGPVDNFHETAAYSWTHMDRGLDGRESNNSAQFRGVSAIHAVYRKPGVTLMATHGTLLALILNALNERYDYSFWQELHMPDAYLMRLSVDKDQLTLMHLARIDW